MSSWHERGSITCPFLSTTDSTADKQQALLFQTLTPPLHHRNTQVLWKYPQAEIEIYWWTVILYNLLLCLCIQSCHRRWWYPRCQEEEPEEDQMQHKASWFNYTGLNFPQLVLTQFSTNYQPVCRWSHPQPVRPWPAGWSSWASSAWPPCPPETPLRSPWSPWPHSAGSRAPWTRFGCKHRPVGEVWWLLSEIKGGEWNKLLCKELVEIHTEVIILPRSHGHSCSWWGSGPWRPNQSVQCLLCEEKSKKITFTERLRWASGHRLSINNKDL